MFESISGLKLIHAGICLTLWHSVLMGFQHVSNSEKGPWWYVVIAFCSDPSVFQVMATLRGRSWRTFSGSWRWPGEAQAWWVQRWPNSTVRHTDHFGYTIFYWFFFLLLLFFARTLRTPHSEKRWRSSCRSLTRTKMDALRCQRWAFQQGSHY